MIEYTIRILQTDDDRVGVCVLMDGQPILDAPAEKPWDVDRRVSLALEAAETLINEGTGGRHHVNFTKRDYPA